jgi:oligopeptide/dipeptide ABC transporter ATP-binding protein
MALACGPSIVIGDEPTTALDVMVQAQIFDLLERLRADLGMSMILITHDLSILGDTCDRVAVMYAGRIVETGTVEEVFRIQHHPYTALLLRSFPDVAGSRLLPESIGGTPPDLLNMPAGCPFRPRCRWADAECAEAMPPFTAVSATHRYSCYHGGDMPWSLS